MTTFQIASDLHSEFYANNPYDIGQLRALVKSLNPKQESRTLLAAGDLSTRRWSKEVYAMLADQFEKVVTIAGNHCLWGGKDFPDEELDKLRAEIAPHSNIKFLENEVAEVGGVKIFGATGWFPEREHDRAWKSHMNDFVKIKSFEPWVYKQNARSKEFLRGATSTDVVMTHHLPSQSAVADRWKNDRTRSAFYVSDFEDILTECRPRLWIHGHTHASMDHVLDDTRVVCNPFGYYCYDSNPDFKKELLVTL